MYSILEIMSDDNNQILVQYERWLAGGEVQQVIGDPRHKEQYSERIERIGVDNILEKIASAILEPQIAAELGVPITVLDDWIAANIPTARLDRAKKLGASTFIHKANLLLRMPIQNTHERTLTQKLAENYFKIAERQDPSKWAPPKDGGKASGTVVFNIGSAETDPGKMISVTPEYEKACIEDDSQEEEDKELEDLYEGIDYE